MKHFDRAMKKLIDSYCSENDDSERVRSHVTFGARSAKDLMLLLLLKEFVNEAPVDKTSLYDLYGDLLDL